MRSRTLQIHTAAICAFVLSSGAYELMPEASFSDESPSPYHDPVVIRHGLRLPSLDIHTWRASRALRVDVNKSQSKTLPHYRPGFGRMLGKKLSTGGIRDSIAFHGLTLEWTVCFVSVA